MTADMCGNTRGIIVPANSYSTALTTKFERGYVFVVLGERKNGEQWEFVRMRGEGPQSIILNCGIRSVGTGLYMTPINISDKIYLIMKKWKDQISFFNYIYRSGYGADDLRYLKITNLANNYNITSRGEKGDKLELEPNRGNDDSQKFIFDFNQKILQLNKI